eukprot:2402741-Amphidinium_carterae.1
MECPKKGDAPKGDGRAKAQEGQAVKQSLTTTPKAEARPLLRDVDAASMVRVGRFGQSLGEGSSRIGLPLQQKPDVKLDTLGGLRAVSRMRIFSTAGRGVKIFAGGVSTSSDWADEADLCTVGSIQLWWFFGRLSAVRLALSCGVKVWHCRPPVASTAGIASA